MQKIRCTLATIVLTGTLLMGGLSLQGLGAAANAASSHHAGSVSSALVVGKSTASVARPNWPCSASNDC